MNILHTISSLDISCGGPSKIVSDLALIIASNDHRISILTHNSTNPYLSENLSQILRIHFTAKNAFRLKLYELIQNVKVDILHGHGIWQLPVHNMSIMARGKDIPYVISPHGMLEPWALNAGKYKKKLALWFYQYYDLERAACIQATSEMEARNIRNLGLKNPIAVIPNGINLSDYCVTRSNHADEEHNILFLSRLHPKKGIEVLIEAWSMLSPDKRKGWKIKIVGNGDVRYISILSKLISSKKLTDEITILGPLFGDEKLKAYQEADIFVLPTYSENFGIVVAEALACGVPVITTKGTPWEELDTYHAGWWIDIGLEPLVMVLNEALSLPESERRIMGNNGRRLVEEKYSIESVAMQMITLYEWIIGKGVKPDFVHM